jgi:hypothetical protein
MGKLIVCLFIISVFFTMCKKQTNKDDAIGFSLLDGNHFILKVDRVSKMPNVQFPRDSLQDSDYVATSEDIQYDITFSIDGQIVTIEPGSVSGERINDGEESKLYKIVEGLFAGGRFVIWINNEDFEAEYTIYGSGIPIIRSERGNLELVIK